MSRLLLPAIPSMLMVLAACDVVDRNPCDRYADFICDCFGESSRECADVDTLAQNPTAEVQDTCEIDLADAQRDTAVCQDTGMFDTDSDAAVARFDTAW